MHARGPASRKSLARGRRAQLRSLIAILRGLEPQDAVAVADVLVAAGIGMIEVPLNSPRPFVSIERIATALDKAAVIGAGTVTQLEEVASLSDAGGKLCVSPNFNRGVVERAIEQGMTPIPGCMTPSECFAALDAGATSLKLFPYSLIGDEGVAAVRAVLPGHVRLYAVGGVGPETFAGSLAAGVNGFGVGSSLYRPGDDAESVGVAARGLVEAYDAAANAHASEGS